MVRCALAIGESVLRYQTTDAAEDKNGNILLGDNGIGKAEQTEQEAHQQPGQPGSYTQPMTNPMAKRLLKAPSNAVFLSGNGIGSMSTTSSAPKTMPAINPRTTFDMRIFYWKRGRSQHLTRIKWATALDSASLGVEVWKSFKSGVYSAPPLDWRAYADDRQTAHSQRPSSRRAPCLRVRSLRDYPGHGVGAFLACGLFSALGLRFPRLRDYSAHFVYAILASALIPRTRIAFSKAPEVSRALWPRVSRFLDYLGHLDRRSWAPGLLAPTASNLRYE